MTVLEDDVKVNLKFDQVGQGARHVNCGLCLEDGTYTGNLQVPCTGANLFTFTSQVDVKFIFKDNGTHLDAEIVMHRPSRLVPGEELIVETYKNNEVTFSNSVVEMENTTLCTGLGTAKKRWRKTMEIAIRNEIKSPTCMYLKLDFNCTVDEQFTQSEVYLHREVTKQDKLDKAAAHEALGGSGTWKMTDRGDKKSTKTLTFSCSALDEGDAAAGAAATAYCEEIWVDGKKQVMEPQGSVVTLGRAADWDDEAGHAAWCFMITWLLKDDGSEKKDTMFIFIPKTMDLFEKPRLRNEEKKKWTRARRIRAFDLGGGGLKTAVFDVVLDAHGDPVRPVPEPKMKEKIGKNGKNGKIEVKSGNSPQKVKDWLREHITNLDQEISDRWYFGASMAELGKIWDPKEQWEEGGFHKLAGIPAMEHRVLDDGPAHLLASKHQLELKRQTENQPPKSIHPVCNIAIGTGVVIWCTDENGRIRRQDEMRELFEEKEDFTEYVVEVEDGKSKSMQQAFGGSHDGNVSSNRECLSERQAKRWYKFLTKLDDELFRKVSWPQPKSYTFTGGVVEACHTDLVDQLKELFKNKPFVNVSKGPTDAGLMGAALKAMGKS